MKKILIVDDDPGLQDAFSVLFASTDYNVTMFENGNRILENEFDLPDIFILDKQLPGADGLDICRFLKGSEATKNIPIIILSASIDIQKQAKTAGADAVLEKPFSIKNLQVLLDKYL